MLKTFDKNHITALSKKYYAAQPFPHLVIDDYLDKTFAKKLEKECRLASHNIDASNGFTQTGKVALNDWSLFSPLIEKTCCYFNSGSFIHLLEQITGIHNLISDPFLAGGGYTKHFAEDI